MYFSSLLFGVKRTTELTQKILRSSSQREPRANSIHQNIGRIETNLFDLFQQLKVCFENLPIVFNPSGIASSTRAVLEDVFETKSVHTDDLPDESVTQLEEFHSNLIQSSRVVFNLENHVVRYHFSHQFLKFLSDKLETLRDALQRLSLRASLGDEKRDELASVLVEGYVEAIDRYLQRIQTAIDIRTEIGDSDVTNITEEAIKPLNESDD